MASTTAKQYTRLLRLWPTDALRPNLPFTRAIGARALPYGVPPPTALTPSNTSPTPSSAPVPATSTATHRPGEEAAQLTALYSLLENRYAKKYVLGDEVFRPASAPEHYEMLMREIERAPGKTWWQAKVDEWKMKIRWQ
ncbi:hypothetical protein EJ07DRAFT_161272 [Lizonia empirigonia]|nr:hypothetical protein EJ07DRAFT_161272 [Lizonia empirigonia]